MLTLMHDSACAPHKAMLVSAHTDKHTHGRACLLQGARAAERLQQERGRLDLERQLADAQRMVEQEADLAR